MRQTLLAILLIVLILATGFVWFRYVKTPAPQAALKAASAGERLAQYRQLKKLKPDTGIFADPLFQSLKAAVPPVQPGGQPGAGQAVPVGRPNPFAPF